MTDHVMHMCSVFGKAEVHKTRLGWQHDELPLNKLRHTKCPYCGEPTENMKPASGADVATLSTDPQSKSYLRGGGGHGSRQSDFSSELLDEVKKLRKEMQDIRDGKKTSEVITTDDSENDAVKASEKTTTTTKENDK